jgi:hypothetical protein
MVDRSGIALTAELEMNNGFNGTRLMPRRHSGPHSLRADDIECLLKAANWPDKAWEGDKSCRSLRAPSHLAVPFSGPYIQRLDVSVRSRSRPAVPWSLTSAPDQFVFWPSRPLENDHGYFGV